MLAGRTLLAGDADVTAIACHNDVTAIGVMHALRMAGRTVPGEFSVIGCDDIAAASWVSPTLTTLAQEKAEMGRLAIETLAASLDDPQHVASPVTVRLPMVLRERESTGPPPRSVATWFASPTRPAPGA